MSMVYSQDEQMLADTAAEFLAAQSPVSAQRKLRDEQVTLGFDAQIWQTMAELGWGAIPFPEAKGGLEFGYKGMGAVFQELGRHLSASPMLSSVVLCGSLIEKQGSEAQQDSWLNALMYGEQRMALALEEHHRFDLGRIASAAAKSGEGYQLTGTKALVFDGLEADAYLVAARLPQSNRLGLFIVHANAVGLNVRNTGLVDSRNNAALELKQVNAELLGSGEEVEALLELVIDSARACLAAEMLGACEALFRMTTDYLKTRKQFDVQIGTFQALQHRAAACFVELELAKSAVINALAAIDTAPGSKETAAAIALAKWKASVMADKVTGEAVQMHGGIGVTDELDVGLYLKRIRVVQMALGDSDYMVSRYHQLTQE